MTALDSAEAVAVPVARRRKRRWFAGVAATGVLAAAVGSVWGFVGGTGSSADTAATGLPPDTTTVERRTLRDTRTADGSLGYGTPRTATSRLRGTLTAVAETGATVSRGKPLYRVDDEPVILMYGTVPAYRDLEAGLEGPDVAQLEKNLRALGYTGFTVDDTYTASTASAVEQWQDDLGLEVTGRVELGRVHFAPGAIRVEAHQAAVGDPTAPGRPVLTSTGTAQQVTVELETADQRLAVPGATVDVTLPDDSIAPGRITDVTTVLAPAAEPDGEATTTVEVVVALTDQKAAEQYVLAAVDVTFTAAERKDVLTVPIGALLALREGGYGVEVVDGTASRYVPVRTGLFSEGRVEISGSGIRPGTVVGVPK